MLPLVSVVVPTRNRPALLRSLLAALDGQIYPHLEIVVADDASGDETGQILRTWARDDRRSLRLEIPQGSYAARNAGWRAARGTIIAFTDDDCLPRPDWVSALVAALTEDAAGVQGRTVVEGGRVTPFTHQIEHPNGGPPYRTCNIAYRRTILEAVGGFRPWRWYADNVLGYQALQLGPIPFAPRAVVAHPPRPREWRTRAAWMERFRTDAAHRAELRRLGVERVAVPGKALPLVLWVARPLLHQGPAHLRAFAHGPRSYLRDLVPLFREKVAMLAALWDYWRSAPPLPPPADVGLISVVIVTRARPGVLAGALQALDRQTYPLHEVIVVDNGAGEARVVAQRAGARYVVATGLTLGAARQAGVEEARAEIIAFTDDDCLPSHTWLHSLATALALDPNAVAVQGRTRAAPGPVDTHAIRVAGPNPLYHTCNIAYRRWALQQAGGFDPSFVGWFEDTDLGARVQALGPILYAHNATVTHRAMPRLPLTAERWRALAADERRLAAKNPAFYRRTRGRSARGALTTRWLIGSAVKTLLRALPHGLLHPHEYLHLIEILVRERRELWRVLGESTEA